MKEYYPISDELSKLDKALYNSSFPIIYYCNVCKKFTYGRISKKKFNEPSHQLRESINCKNCRSTNRNRQIAEVICLSNHAKNKYSSLLDFSRNENISIFNTEADRPIHNILKSMGNYICSEFLGNNFKSGDIINGIMHQDIMSTSFDGNSFDLVITSDILEHVSDPWKAFKEIHRILKPGGRHVFTVPFFQKLAATQERSYLNHDGKIINVLEPKYNYAPLNYQDVLVYNIFSIDFLGRLEIIGFKTIMYKLHRIFHGILGPNGIVFESIKR